MKIFISFLLLVVMLASLVAQTPKPYNYGGGIIGDCLTPNATNCYGVGLVVPNGVVVSRVDLNDVLISTDYWKLDPTGNMVIVKVPFQATDIIKIWY